MTRTHFIAAAAAIIGMATAHAQPGPYGATGTPALTGGTITGTTLINPTIGTSVGSTSAFINSQSGFAGSIFWRKSGTNSWSTFVSGDTQTGNNAGSLLDSYSYSDTGSLIGQLFGATRGSGHFGTGIPYWHYFAPYNMTQPRAVAPGGIIGNLVNFANDAQPTAALANNPLTTTNGSAVVTVAWAGCCSSGPVSATVNTWVNLSGAAAVGGITPTGWVEVTATPSADSFTFTWTSVATSSATGGGASVTVTPSFQVQTQEVQSVATSGAGGFAVQNTELYIANPSFLPLASSPHQADFASRWSQTYSPTDTSQTKNFATSYGEFNLVNRGSDEGYSPNLYASVRNTLGWWTGADATVASWVPGGGTGHNWNTVFSIYSTGGLVGVYDGWSIQPNALVGAANDPTSHGGVGRDDFGSYDPLPGNPFATTNGTSTVTVTTTGDPSGIASQANGNSVYIPSTYTLNSVTFGGGNYTIGNVNTSAHTFTITGSGTANATGSGGGSSQWIAFASTVPYAPQQMWGEWKHGLITKNYKSDSGLLIETQPGYGMGWGDGTGTASVNAVAVSPGNINVVLTPAGSGSVTLAGVAVVTTAVVSGAGANQATATLLSAQASVATTVAAGTGVRLPATVGAVFLVLNRGANALLVYPPTGAQFEAGGANVAISVAAGASAEIFLTSATQGYVR